MHTHFHGQGQVNCVSTRCHVDSRDSTRQLSSVDAGPSTRCLCCVDPFLHPSTCSTRGRNTNWSFHDRQGKQQKYGFAPVVRNRGGGDISNISNLTTPLSVDCSVEYEMPCLPSIPPDSAPILQIMSRSDLSTKGSCHKSAPAPPGTHGSHGSKLSDLTLLEAPAPPSQLTKPPSYNWTQSYQNTMAIKAPSHNTMATRTPCHNTMGIKTPYQHGAMGVHDMRTCSTCLAPCHGDVPCRTSSHGSLMGVMDQNAMGARIPSHQDTFCDSINVRTASSQLQRPAYYVNVDNMGSRIFSHPQAVPAIMGTRTEISHPAGRLSHPAHVPALMGNRTETSNPNAIRTRPDISQSARIGTRSDTFHPTIVMETRQQHISQTHPGFSNPRMIGTQPDISHPTKREPHLLPDMSKPGTLRRQHGIPYPDTIRNRPHLSHPDNIRNRPHLPHPHTTRPHIPHPHLRGTRTVESRPEMLQPNLGLTVGCISIAMDGSPGSRESLKNGRTDSLQHVMDRVQPSLQLQAARDGRDGRADSLQGFIPSLQLQAGRDGRQTAGSKRKLTMPSIRLEQCVSAMPSMEQLEQCVSARPSMEQLEQCARPSMEQLEQCARPIYLETNRKLGDSDGLQSALTTQSGSIKRQRLSYPGLADINQASAGGTAGAVWPHNAYYSSSSGGAVNNGNLGYMGGHAGMNPRGYYRDIRYGFHSF